MGLNRSRSTLIAAVLSAALVGGGVTAIAPAVADDGASYAATNWKKIWKKKLQKYADKRYYTKAQSDAKYASKIEVGAALGNYYTKAQSDAGYAQKATTYTKTESDANYYKKAESDANYYKKAESDAKYAPFPTLIKGHYDVIGVATAAGSELADNISFGTTLSAPPTPHYIRVGDPGIPQCPGTVAAPNAQPGHLCLFEAQNVLANLRRTINANGIYGLTSSFGVGILVTATGAGNMYVYGSWAVRPAALAAVTATGPSGPQGSGPRAGE